MSELKFANTNTCTIQGNVGKEPVSKELSWGTVINFSIAHTKGYKDKQTGEFIKKGDIWFDIQVKNPGDDYPPVSKGDRVQVTGPIDLRSYQKSNGETGYSLQIDAWQVQIVSKSRQSSQSGSFGNDPF